MAQLSRAQHGVFSREQIARIGATRGLIQYRLGAGRWERIAPGVFRLAGTPPSWPQSLMAACLAWGEGAVVSHLAAAPLWTLAGFEPGPVEVTVPRGRHRRGGPGVVHYRVLLPRDVTVIGAIPVTTPARTLIDIVSVAPLEAVEEALDDALRRRIVSLPRLSRRLRELRRSGRPGIAAMRALLEARDPTASVPQSVFETRLLRALRRAGLPEPVPQHRVRSGGRVVAVVDFAFPAARLAVEADGYRWHSGRTRWEHDRARSNDLTLLGWRVIHVTWTALRAQPERVIDFIARALAREG